MSEEILPCPNPECRGKCSLREQDDRCYGGIECHVACDNSKCFHRSPLAATRYKSPGCVDGRFNPRAEAIRLHNALPREEPWIEVAKAGLPEPSEQLYDVAGEHDGKPFLTEMVTRADVSWELGNATVRVHSDKYGGVSHYRIHRAPKGPKG